jgi:hypothetical protein
MCGWRIHPVTCIKPLKFEKVMKDAGGTLTGEEFLRASISAGSADGGAKNSARGGKNEEVL